MTLRRFRNLAWIPALLLFLVSCGTDDQASQRDSSDRLLVVTSLTILGDIASNIVGDDADLVVLIPLGADPHDYQMSAAQVAMLHDTDLVISSGLGEEAIDDVLKAAQADGVNLMPIGPLLDPLPYAGAEGESMGAQDDGHTHDEGEEAHAHDEGEGAHTHGPLDPHFWMDPFRVAKAGHLIAERLAELDPSIDWEARADAYRAQIEDLDAEIQTILAPVPGHLRKLITNHNALGYFAARYDFEVVDTIIPGGSTLAEPSSAEMTALVETIDTEGIPVIFGETIESTALAEALAAAAGSDVAVVELYTSSLGEPGSGAETVIGMLRVDAQLIADALLG